MNFKIKDFLRKNIIPILAEIVLIISFLYLPSHAHIYVNTLFYLLLFGYIIYKKDFSLNAWITKIKSGKDFWKKTSITIFGFIMAVIISALLENNYTNLNTGAIKLTVNNWFDLICFVLSTILLPAITEEIIFRKNMISLKRDSVFITSFISMLLFSAEHYLSIWGIFLGLIWAVPLTISYIKTKDIYVPMTAHFIVSLLGNGIDAISMFLKMFN